MKNKYVTLISFIILSLFITNDNIIIKFYHNIKPIKFPNSNLVLVNKFNKLENNYIPKDLEKINVMYANEHKYLRHHARINFEKMSRDASKLHLNIICVSSFRSYRYQEELYYYYVNKKGLTYALLCSAMPGHSEHQTGLAIDIMGSNKNYNLFEKSKEFKWVKNNAHKYGYILRYPEGKEYITGFKYEPWHYRYIGIKEATFIYTNNLCLEEYMQKDF